MKVRLTEGQLKNIIAESIRKALKEEREEMPQEKERPMRIYGGNLEGTYDKDEFIKNYPDEIKEIVTPEKYPHLMSALQGYPRLKEYVGPMYDGDTVRYESEEVNRYLSL